MSKSIFEITSDALTIDKSLVESEGELTPELEKLITVHQSELASKVDNYAAILEQFNVALTLWKAREERDSRMVKKYSNIIDRLENNLMFAMKCLEMEKISGAETAFKLRKNAGRVIVEDENSVPDEFKIKTIVTTIDKKTILKHLRDGIPVSGCRLEMSESLMETSPDIL